MKEETLSLQDRTDLINAVDEVSTKNACQLNTPWGYFGTERVPILSPYTK